MWHWPRPSVDRLQARRRARQTALLLHGRVPPRVRLGFRTHMGYHAARDTVPRGIPPDRPRRCTCARRSEEPRRPRNRRRGRAPSAAMSARWERTVCWSQVHAHVRGDARALHAVPQSAARCGLYQRAASSGRTRRAGVALRPQRTLSPLRCAALLHAAEAAAGRTRSRSLRIASLRGCL